jgi:protein BUR2
MVFLAAKVEETPRKLKDVILKGLTIRFKSAEVVSETSPEYLKLYDRIIILEKTVLAGLCFDLTVDHPFRHLARLFNSHPDSNKRVVYIIK